MQSSELPGKIVVYCVARDTCHVLLGGSVFKARSFFKPETLAKVADCVISAVCHMVVFFKSMNEGIRAPM